MTEKTRKPDETTKQEFDWFRTYLAGFLAVSSFVFLSSSFGYLRRLEGKLNEIKALQAPQIRTENVLGLDAPEKFYEINGQRAYLEIDGKPAEQYFAEQAQEKEPVFGKRYGDEFFLDLTGRRVR